MKKVVFYIVILIVGAVIMMSSGIIKSFKSIDSKHQSQIEQVLNEMEE